MKADWDDAPIRVRKRPNHTGIVVSIAMVLGIFSGAVYMADSKGWLERKPSQPVQAVIQPKPTPQQVVEDDYDEQVNRLALGQARHRIKKLVCACNRRVAMRTQKTTRLTIKPRIGLANIATQERRYIVILW